MRKMKKFLAAVLAMALTMSMVPMTALADTTGGASVVNPAQTTGETIDTTKTGSLTVYKYEFRDGTTTGTSAGTGQQEQIPDGATVIEGVGFTLYKVSDLDSYYASDSVSLPTTAPSNLANLTPIGGAEQLTDTDGKVSWTNLDLGIYYVVESTPPVSAVSNPVEFYVSIPMTTVNGESWLYDVVVYPKNTTSYAGVILKKIGNNTDTTLISDARFVLEKYDSTNTAWYYVKNTETDDAKPANWTYNTTEKNQATVFSTGDAGTIQIEGLSYGIYRFTETYAPDGYIMDETIYHAFEIDQAGKVYNYNVATTATGDEITDKTIVVNNEKPAVDKQTKNVGGTWGDDADYSIGDEVPFRIVVDVPANINKLKTFKVTDIMSDGLKLEDTSRFTIKGYTSTQDIDTDADAGAEITGVNVATDTTKPQEWTVEFSNDVKATIAAANYEKIVIEFTAKLDTDAVIAGTGNANDVKLTYSNQILTDSNPDDTVEPEPTESELTDKVVVYTFQINLTKTFAGPVNGESYSATFQLYRAKADGGISLKLSDGSIVQAELVESATVTYKTDENGAVVTESGATLDGTLIFDGLENGDYYLVETATAPGYNLLKAPVAVTINRVYETTITTTSETDANGKVTETTTSTTKYYTDTSKANELADTDVTQTIINSKGFVLPTTGGVGTYIFVFVGVSMMVAAVLLFVTTKKKESETK